MLWLMHLYTKRTPLILVIAFILIGDFALTNIISFHTSKNILRQALIKNELPMVSERIYSEIKLDLLPPILASSALAHDFFIRDWIRKGEADKNSLVGYLAALRSEYNAMTCFLVSERSRTYYNPNGSFHISEDDPDAAWYFRFRDSGKTRELNNTINTDMDNMPTIFINYRMTDHNNEFTGVAGMGLELESIPRILEEYKANFERHVYFVDSQGTIITRSQGAMIRQENLHDIPGVEHLVHKIFTGDLEFFEYQVSGDIMLVNSRYITELGWWVLIEQKETEILRNINQVLFANALINLAAIVLTMVLVFFAVSLFHKKLEKMASTDRLTGISNRQMFEYALQQALARFSRVPSPFSVFFIDLDHFKKINDTLGHLEGDQVLKRTANIIQQSIRQSDDFSRWGGEEFIILAHDCNVHQGFALAEKIRKAIEDACIGTLPDKEPVTVSIGVSEVRENDSEDTLLQRADQALYQAKEAGRNCVRYA